MDGVRPASWYDHRPSAWVALADRPAREVHTQALTPGPGGSLGTGGDFTVNIASPQHCEAAGGEYCATWLGPEMPGDQRVDDAYSACFETDSLPETAIVGAPELRLSLRSDQPNAQLAVRLNHIHPDGASTRITWGALNLTHFASHAEPVPLVPGEVIKVTVSLDHIAYKLPAGLGCGRPYLPLLANDLALARAGGADASGRQPRPAGAGSRRAL